LPPITSPLHTRLKRRKPTPPHTHEARIGGRTVPKELVKSLAEPSIHRPQKWCLLMEVSRTSGVKRKYGCSAGAPLRDIGLSPPLQAPNSRRVPGNALARVDVPNRYLGNKACKYETKKWCPPPKLRCEQRRSRGEEQKV
jgi:hypothetical protein